jgi:hypothetical protein
MSSGEKNNVHMNKKDSEEYVSVVGQQINY